MLFLFLGDQFIYISLAVIKNSSNFLRHLQCDKQTSRGRLALENSNLNVEFQQFVKFILTQK